MLILVALKPRLYSEAIGNVIRHCRPHLEVKIVEQDALDSAVARLDPKLVLCSQDGPVDMPEGLVWIEYRPYAEPKATIHVRGQRFELDVVDLAGMLSVVDKAEDLV